MFLCNDYNLYTKSRTYAAHSAGVFDLLKVCQGIGFPIVTLKVLCRFLNISSAKYSIAILKRIPKNLQIFARL